MKISIIIPAYNAEKYIGRCIESSLGQSYDDIEVIVVDDGSTDGTLDVINEYKKRDHRLRLLHQGHVGPNAARKRGLEAATGEYVMFVDADDYILRDAVSILVDRLRTRMVDVIRFNAMFENSQKIVLPMLDRGESEKIIWHDEIIKNLLTTYSLNSLSMQIYKTELLRQVDAFSSNVEFGEDFLVNLEIHQNTERMLLIPGVLYCYCDNPSSITRSCDKVRLIKNLVDRIAVSGEAVKYATKYISEDHEKYHIYYSQIKMIKGTIQNLARVSYYKKKEFLNDMQRVLLSSTFSEIDREKLEVYMRTLNMKEKIKNKSVVRAIVCSDYEFLWRYMRLFKAKDYLRRVGR